MSRKGKYNNEFITQALKLAKEIGNTDAAKQLGINKSTISWWKRQYKKGSLMLNNSDKTPEGALSIEEEIKLLRERNKALEKQHRKDQEKIDFLEEATAFFAASHPRLRKMNDSNS